MTRESGNALARDEAILQGATEVFSAQGFAATSMRQIAETTGASLGSIYYHFESKEAILRAIICGNLRRVTRSLEERLAGVEDPRRKVEIFVENHISFFSAHLAAMRVMSHELDTLKGPAGAEIAALRREYAHRAEAIIRELRPDLPSDEHRIATWSLFGMLNWTYRWFHTLPEETDPARLARRMAALFLDGYSPGPSAGS